MLRRPSCRTGAPRTTARAGCHPPSLQRQNEYRALVSTRKRAAVAAHQDPLNGPSSRYLPSTCVGKQASTRGSRSHVRLLRTSKLFACWHATRATQGGRASACKAGRPGTQRSACLPRSPCTLRGDATRVSQACKAKARRAKQRQGALHEDTQPLKREQKRSSATRLSCSRGQRARRTAPVRPVQSCARERQASAQHAAPLGTRFRLADARHGRAHPMSSMMLPFVVTRPPRPSFSPSSVCARVNA